MEILFAPLRGASGEIDRLMGLYQPLSPVAPLFGGATRPLQIRGISATNATSTSLPRLRLAAVDGRHIA
jgi:hypothetical protein